MKHRYFTFALRCNTCTFGPQILQKITTKGLGPNLGIRKKEAGFGPVRTLCLSGSEADSVPFSFRQQSGAETRLLDVVEVLRIESLLLLVGSHGKIGCWKGSCKWLLKRKLQMLEIGCWKGSCECSKRTVNEKNAGVVDVLYICNSGGLQVSGDVFKPTSPL
jgi:hypothetical protein